MVAKSMRSKTLWALAVLGLAAFSPAPINSGIPSPKIPEMTQEQLTKQQQFCGALPVVGTVPVIQREGGLSGSIQKKDGDTPKVEGAGTEILYGSRRADHIGAEAAKQGEPKIAGSLLQSASEMVEEQERKRRSMPMMVVLMLALGYLVIQITRRIVDKVVPVPKKIATAR